MYVCLYEKCRKSIKPVKRTETHAGRLTQAELRSQGSRASGRTRKRSGQSVPDATKESDDLEEVAIEVLTERHRMTVEERRGVALFLYSLWATVFSAEIHATSQVCDNAQERLNLRTRRHHSRANMTEVNPHARDDINKVIVVDMLKPERKSPR